MADFAVKYADGRGQIHQQVATAGSEKELRDRYVQQGYLIYSIKSRDRAAAAGGFLGRRKKLDLEKFLIFNQQFVSAKVRPFGPAAACHLDAFDAKRDAFVEHIRERQIRHDVGADREFHVAVP